MLEPYGQEPKQPQETHNDFDWMQEISRGALYAGGDRAENWWEGYAFGDRLVILLLAGLFVFGVLKEFVASGDAWKMQSGNW